MNFFKRQWHNFKNYVEDNKKTIIRNFIILFIVIVILLIIDLVCKQCLFKDPGPDDLGPVQSKSWLFGIRSVRNTGLTFATKANANIALVTFFNIVIWLACIVFTFFLRSMWFAIFIGFIFAGSMGNTIDRLAFGYVRDFVYLPWCDKGTFNWSDVDVMVGCFGVIITMLTIYIVGAIRRK